MSRIINIINHIKAERGPRQIMNVAVHDGKFHLDELVALSLVRMVCDPEKIKMNIVRTRDQKILDQQDLVLDVGYRNSGSYFDHHQADFNVSHTIGTYSYKFATSGLVWQDLGMEVLRRLHDWTDCEEHIDTVYDTVNRKLIIPVDAIDNGEWRVKLTGPTPLMLPDIVSHFNEFDEDLQDDNFHTILNMVHDIFYRRIRMYCRSIVAIQKIVEQMRHPTAEDSQDRILTLLTPGPWLAATSYSWADSLKFQVCLYKSPGREDLWNIQTFPAEPGVRNSQRCGAPRQWRGWSSTYHDKSKFSPEAVGELERLGVAFVHSSGFMCTVQGTLAQAREVAKTWIQKGEHYETL